MQGRCAAVLALAGVVLVAGCDCGATSPPSENTDAGAGRCAEQAAPPSVHWVSRIRGTPGEQGYDGYAFVSDAEVTTDGDFVASGTLSGGVVFGVDEAGETALTASDPHEYDSFLAKYGRDGSLQWIRQASVAWVFGIAASPEGGAYVTGSAEVLNVGRADEAAIGAPYFVARYDRDGGLVWVTPFSAAPGFPPWLRVSASSAGAVRVFGVGQITLRPREADELTVGGVAFVADLDADGEVLGARGVGQGDPTGYASLQFPPLALDDGGALGIAGMYCGDGPVWGEGAGTDQPPTFCCDLYCDTELPSPEEASLFVAKYDPEGRVLWHVTTEAGEKVVLQPVRSFVGPTGLTVTGWLTGRATFGRGSSAQTTLEGGPTTGFFAQWDEQGTFRQATTGPLAGVTHVASDGDLLGSGALSGDWLASFGHGECEVTVDEPSGFFARWRADGALRWVRLLPGTFDAPCCPERPDCCHLSTIGFGGVIDAGEMLVTWGGVRADYALTGEGRSFALSADDSFVAGWQ